MAVNRKTITTTLLKILLWKEKALLGFPFFFRGRVSSCPAIVFSSLLWVLGFRQTKTCQAKWTLIAFKPKLSSFCVDCLMVATTAPYHELKGKASSKPFFSCKVSDDFCQNFNTRTAPPTRFMTFAVDIFSPKKWEKTIWQAISVCGL